MSTTTRLGMTLLQEGQTGAEIVINSALQKLDLISAVVITDMTVVATPPGSPSSGDTYFLADATPTGAWSGHAWEFATWDGSAWVFFQLNLGTIAFDLVNKVLQVYTPEGTKGVSQWTAV